MSARRGAVVVPAALVAAVILGVGVWAFFDGTGQGSAQATLATLSAPGNVTASSTAGTTTVSLIWGASTLSNGLAVDGYYATRTNTSTLVTSAACGTSSASLTTSTSCSDTSVPDGTYTYAVIALFRSWSATATSNSVTVISDITAPTQAISLTAATGAYLSGSTLYWNGTNTTTGSFKLADAVTDSGSGPASAAFPAIGAAGWAHAAETVTSGSGSAPTITYTSSTYSWGASAANPADQVITGRDAAGNTVTTTLHFTDDISGPTGGSVDASGLVGTGSRYSTSTTLSIAFGKGTDSGSGLATGAVLTRAQATLSSSDGQANGTCGSYGSFTTLATDPTSPYTDNAAGGVSTGHCYEYEYVVPDNVGNQTTYTSPDVKVQTSAPGSLTPIVSLSSATGNTFVTGTTAYIDPQTGKSGSFQTAATASDSVSGLQKVDFPALTGFTSGGGDVASLGRTRRRTAGSAPVRPRPARRR